MIYGPGVASLERYRDETVPNWHDRLVGEVALRATKKVYADRAAAECDKPNCRSCRAAARFAGSELEEAGARLRAELKRLRSKLRTAMVRVP